jgi:tRNA G18 (ribose-2'-O)-methylase SpoU
MGTVSTYTITSLDQPGLQPYRTLRRTQEHIKEGIFVAEGEKVVQRLLDTNLRVISLLVTPDRYEQLNIKLISRKAENIHVYIGDKSLLGTIVGFNLHQGILAVARIPDPVSLDDLIKRSSEPYCLVGLDGLTNSENVGVVVRNCAALGAAGILVGETSSSPYLRRAVRNSMGGVFRIPVVHTEHMIHTLGELQRRNVRIIAAHPAGPTRLADVNLTGNACILFGNEDAGISPDVLALCDMRVSIPMSNDTDSLNVSSASAVFLYEVKRRRSGPSGF